MAKKKRKYLIKLNNKVRDYFGGVPFDSGIEMLSDEELIALVLSIGLRLPSLDRYELLRGLRREWSDGDYIKRSIIVKNLLSNDRSKEIDIHQKTPIDKVDKIVMLLGNIEHTKDEESTILDSFIDIKSSKITEDKIVQKLNYIRLKDRFGLLENSVDMRLNTLNEMEFLQSYSFKMRDVEFRKIFLDF